MKNLLLIAIVALLAACSDHPAPSAQQYQAPPAAAQAAPAVAGAPGQPVIINNTQPANNGMTDMLLGGALGYMMGSAGSNRSAPAPQVVERRVIVREVPRETVNRPPVQAAAPAPTASATPIGPLPKVVPATPPAAKPFAYGSPPAPQPKVTYGAGFASVNASPIRPSAPTVTSRPGAYSARR